MIKKELRMAEATQALLDSTGRVTRMRLYTGYTVRGRKPLTLVRKGIHVDVPDSAIRYTYENRGRVSIFVEASKAIVYGYINHNDYHYRYLAASRRKQYLASATGDLEMGRMTLFDEAKVLETCRMNSGVMVYKGRPEYGAISMEEVEARKSK